MTRQHDSWCVHRIGSDHPDAECGRCERGDCDERIDTLVPVWLQRQRENGARDLTGQIREVHS
jgi:hypothetical protein